jgi:RNA 3'-terminal phosphate cyclase (ATP)
VPPFTAELKAINCDHNYVAHEKHFGESVLITRKGAVREREGGTHNPAAPPFDFLARSFLPLLERMGPKVQLQFDRYGFYPAGGGRFCAEIHPAKALTGIQIGERGEITSRRATAVEVNLPRHIAQREVETVGKMLNWGPGAFSVQESRNSAGPGNIVMIEIGSAEVTEILSAFGQVALAAEKVAFYCGPRGTRAPLFARCYG